jgi:DNA-binding PadR family transcriptional regulator
MDLKTVLLGFLARNSLTGYDLRRLMERSVGFFFGASYGSIYPALRDLEEKGLVRSTLVIQEVRPNKKVYELTSAGRESFEERLAERSPADDAYRSEFLMHLFFGEYHEPERLVEMVEAYANRYSAKLEVLRDVEAEFGEAMSPYQRMCLHSGLSHYRSRLEWCGEVEKQLRVLVGKRNGTEA